jgi:hypothetical protein
MQQTLNKLFDLVFKFKRIAKYVEMDVNALAWGTVV